MMDREMLFTPAMIAFPLIRTDKVSAEPDQGKAFLWLMLIAIVVCALFVWLQAVWLLLLLLGTVLIFRFVGLPRRLFPDWPRSKDIIGELRVNDDGLILLKEGEQEFVRFQDVHDATLEHNHIKGEALAPRDIEHNGIATLSLSLRNGHSKTIKFLVGRREQVPGVEFLLRTMYKRGIPLKEFVGRERIKTILFKHGRSFKEIQALKEELGIGSFY